MHRHLHRQNLAMSHSYPAFGWQGTIPNEYKPGRECDAQICSEQENIPTLESRQISRSNSGIKTWIGNVHGIVASKLEARVPILGRKQIGLRHVIRHIILFDHRIAFDLSTLNANEKVPLTKITYEMYVYSQHLYHRKILLLIAYDLQVDLSREAWNDSKYRCCFTSCAVNLLVGSNANIPNSNKRSGGKRMRC